MTPTPKRDATAFSRAIADILTGRQKRTRMPDGHRMTQDDLVESTGIAKPTLQRKLAGESEIKVGELERLCAALSIDAASVVAEAQAEFASLEQLTAPVSPAPAIPVDLDRKRKARAMPPEQLEQERHAATLDPELDTDEPGNA